MSRHKWNDKVIGNVNDYKGGLSVACVKCGCVKELVRGRLSYFINDSCYDKAPDCDERLLNSEQKPERSVATDDHSSNAAGETVIGTKKDQCPDPHTGEVTIHEIK